MKQKLLLMVLALGMCCINVNAQTYKVEDDGFEWYYIVNNDTPAKSGAQDKYGNILIPTEYSNLWYDSTSHCFNVYTNSYMGIFNRAGKCIVSPSRRYTHCLKCDWDDYHDFAMGTWYLCEREDGGTDFCDINGKIVFSSKLLHLSMTPYYKEGKYYIVFSNANRKYGILDGNENVVIAPTASNAIHVHKGRLIENKNHKDYGSAAKIKTTKNIFEGNPRENLSELDAMISSRNHHTNSTTQSTTNSYSSNGNNSVKNTTTIHVEHHHDPVPVQQWQACFGCGGMGTMGCDNCGGSGTKYIGDRLHRCSRCNGRGIIPCNICYGNKGQYVTVYK